MKVTNYYEDLKTLHVNTREPRCYYVPLDTNEKEKRRCLSGNDWKFNYYECIEAIPESFKENDFKEDGFKIIAVPSVWQASGYDYQQYSCEKYPFPYDPPFVPDMDPCGAYIKTFDLTKTDERQFLYFEGVMSCFYVYLNEQFIGYSQVSHSPSEFEITKYVKEGKNILKVVVLKWCDGSYLEDQDMFRQCGIFRDVYLLTRPHNFINDFTITTNTIETGCDVIVTFDDLSGKNEIRVELYDKDELIASATTEGDPIALAIKDPVMWSAEIPYLYTLKLKTKDEVIIQKVGYRTIEIRNSILYINNENIKLRGVNRHDSDPVKGYAVSREDVIRDLKMMKEYNINALRTAHYPNAPYLPELCDELGLYVIAESDLECHGTAWIYGSKGQGDTFGLLSQNPDWHQAYLDRQKRNVIRDKNHPCIFMWSLGNESGFGPNLEDCGEWIHKYDPTRLVHYEGSWWESCGYKNNNTSMLDVFSRMYPPTEWVKDYLEDNRQRKPLLLCEFVHSMGNGPGDIEDYMSLLYHYDKFAGAFVWEWCDHAYLKGYTKDHKPIYYYGGDSNEYPHDGNFCMDGLTYPDRRPHTGLYEWKNAIRPVRAQLKDNVLTLTNEYDFKTLSNIQITCEVKENGKLIKTEEINVNTKAHMTEVIPLDLPYKKNTYLKVTYTLKKDEGILKKGHVLGFDQFPLFHKEKERILLKSKETLILKETEQDLIIESEKIHYVYRKKKANFISLIKNDKENIVAPVKWNVYRAPVDNDFHANKEWILAGYERLTTKVYDTEYEVMDNIVHIHVNFSCASIHRQPYLNIKATWSINSDGDIRLSLDAHKAMDFPYLPRFGLIFTLDKTKNKITYYGYGPYESYIDKHRASYKDLFKSTVKELHEDYVKPQENGSHYDCDYVKINNFTFKPDVPCSFNASNYSIEQLASAHRNTDLIDEKVTYLNIDYKMSGIGSNSCGPKLLPQYQFNEENFHWELLITL